MPYIKQSSRAPFDALVDDFAHTCADVKVDEGQLNYLITNLLIVWLGLTPRYTNYNAALGVLEAVKLELYRRRVAPYEETKITENGDVY